MDPIPIRPGTVSQDLLLEYIRKRNRRRKAEQSENEIAERILTLLSAGAMVEPGIHYAEVERLARGAKITHKLKVG